MADFSDYLWLVSDEAAAYLARLAEDPQPALKQLTSLRRSLPAERARLLVEQVDLRRRAVTKFGSLASQLFFTPILLEQATDLCLAGYKATRFLPFGEQLMVHDYCCGIGGDLMMLATRGPHAGWDLSEVACLLATANLRVVGSTASVQQADVSVLTPIADEAWHVDPDRRAGGSRSTKLERHSPGPDVVDRWRQTSPDGVVKLAPASTPPAHWRRGAELEWISSVRQCRQLVVWFGGLALLPGLRRATQIIRKDLGGILGGSLVGPPGLPCESSDAPGEFLYDPDPAVLAADLQGQLALDEQLATLGRGGSYLTSDRDVDHPLLQKFIVEECLPLRTSLVAQYLAARNVGVLEVKKRGVSTDPEKFRRDLKLRGDNAATVILTRIGQRQVAIIADRPPTSDT